MLAIAINAVTIIIGSIIGLLVKNNVKKSVTDAVMVGIGLFTVYLAVAGLKSDVSSIVFLLAIIFGGIIGGMLHLEDRINSFADRLQTRLSANEEDNRFASGFVGFFVMSCVGAFTLVASFNVGLGDNSMMYTKAVMDFIVSMALASSLGIGVLAAGVPIILFESILAFFSASLSSTLSPTVIDAFSCAGAILTFAIGTNVVGITKFKVVDYTPSLLLAPLFASLFELF